jgi:hypothetical protein
MVCNKEGGFSPGVSVFLIPPPRRKKRNRVAMKSKFEKEVSKLCRRFGTIAVKRGFVSADQVKEAFGEQLDDDLNGRNHRLIGTILSEKELMTWPQIDSNLRINFYANWIEFIIKQALYPDQKEELH